MRKKIEELNNEVFRYYTPDIIVSEDRIEGVVRPNKLFTSSIEITTSDSSVINGTVYSENDIVSIKNGKFEGIRNEIQFELFVDSSISSNHIDGNIIIISDCGEKKVPYYFEISKEGYDTPIGVVKDLFQFTDLAMEYPNKALEIFCTDSFKRIFLSGNRYGTIYDGLIKNSNAMVAMEEFLVEINKKKKINLLVEEKEKVYYVGKENVKDELIIKKSSWGYCKYKVNSDRDCIKFEKDYITSEDFYDGVCKLKYEICNVSKIGKSLQMHIFIENIYEKISVDIRCVNKEKNLISDREDDKRILYGAFERNYINFKVGIIDIDRYIADSELITKNLEEYGKSYMNDLYKIHLLILQKNNERATKAIKSLENRLNVDYTARPIIRCVCMYYKCITKKDNRKILKTSIEAIRSYYDNECHTWEFLSLLLKLDSRYVDKPERKIEAMREMSARGCISPVMYYEAALIIKDKLELLERIGKFEVQVINWAIKNFFMNEDMSKAYAINIARIREFNPLVYRTLIKLYDMYEQKEVVNAICMMLLKGQMYGKKCYEWYEKAIEYNLRITGLFEGYLYSCDESKKEMLPDIVYSYFLGNDNISDKRKAFLYYSLVKHKEHNKNMYEAYFERIRDFAIEQMKLGFINRQMKVVYEDVFKHIKLSEVAKYLPNILFMQEIRCSNPVYKGVLVKHKVMDEEQYVPIVNETAIVNVFSKSSSIFLVDFKGNRHIAKSEYKIDTLLDVNKYADECFKYTKDNDMLVLFLADKIDSYAINDDKERNVKKQVVKIENLNKKYKNRCLFELVVYAYEDMQIELLDEYLEKIDIDFLEAKEKIYIMECYIIRGMWKKAIKSIKENGYQELPINKLLRLVQKIIDSEDMEEKDTEKEILVNICVYIFKKGKYNKSTLGYIKDHLLKDLDLMCDIWKALRREKLDTKAMEEGILTYMLYTDAYLVNSYDIFESYYQKDHDKVLVDAYLKYNAYRYVVKGRVLNEKMYDILNENERYKSSDLLRMANLKHLSEEKELSELDKMTAISEVEYFMEKDIILSFFRKFELECMKDKYIIEYITDPKVRVDIIYNMGDDDTFYNEEMKDVFFGIRSRSFILFYGDNLQYYIVEDNKGDNKITESLNLNVINSEQDDESRYGKINLMLMTKEMKDEETLIDTMKGLAITDYITQSIFAPL